MKYTELKNSIEEGAKSVYLLQGDDAYFRMKGEEQIKAAFLEMPELNFTSFDGESLKGAGLSALVAAVKNYPFMAERRVIKVTEFYPSDAEFERYLKPLFDDFPPSSVLIIVNTGAGKGADLKRKRAVTFIDCNKADVITVSKWVYVTMKRAGVGISAAASECVAEYCLCDMSRVAVEVQKLIDYKREGEVAQEEVDALIYKDADYRIYELTNAAARRDYTKFCLIADELVSKAGDEMYVLNGLFNYFKNVLTALTVEGSDAEIATLLKMKEYGVKKNREAGESLGEKRLVATVEYIYGRISGVKRGLVTPQNALSLVENYIFFDGGAK